MYLYRVLSLSFFEICYWLTTKWMCPNYLFFWYSLYLFRKLTLLGFFFYFRSNTILFMNVSWGSYCLQGASLKRTSLGNITSVWWKLKTVLPLESWSNSSWWGFFLLWLSYTCKLNFKKNVGNVVAKFLETEPNMVKQWCKHLT